MTNLEAVQAEIEPFTLSKSVLEKALIDTRLNGSSEYSGEYAEEKAVGLASVKALSKLVVLANETEGKFTQGYTAGAVEKRINAICQKFGFNASEFVSVSSISDGSNMW